MTRNIKYFWGTVIFSAFIFSCRKEKSYSVIPVITYKNVTEVDTLDNQGKPITLYRFNFGFTDGDGDIGTIANDTTIYNCFFKIFEKENGVFNELTNVNPPYNYIIPNITPDERNKNISGNIGIEISEDALPFKTNDTLKCEIYILDRALHQSNIITTDEFIINKQ